MPAMLRHKETGELFIYTPLLAQNEMLELVTPDPVAEALASMAEKTAPVAETAPAKPSKATKAISGK